MLDKSNEIIGSQAAPVGFCRAETKLPEPPRNAFPIAQPPPSPLPSEVAGESDNARNVNDPHLRSTHAVTGYHLQTSEETIGHIADFMMDDKSWAICRLVVETGTWFSGKEIVISPSHVDRINYEDSKVFVNLTKEAILQAPEFHVPTLGATNSDAQNLAGHA